MCYMYTILIIFSKFSLNKAHFKFKKIIKNILYEKFHTGKQTGLTLEFFKELTSLIFLF